MQPLQNSQPCSSTPYVRIGTNQPIPPSANTDRVSCPPTLLLPYSFFTPYASLQQNTHCNENPIYVFFFWELRGLSPNFHIHVSVSDVYSIFPGLVPHIFLQQNRQINCAKNENINGSQTHEYGNWDSSRAIPFLEIFVSNFRFWFFAVLECGGGGANATKGPQVIGGFF
jgi:hypothetical protein